MSGKPVAVARAPEPRTVDPKELGIDLAPSPELLAELDRLDREYWEGYRAVMRSNWPFPERTP